MTEDEMVGWHHRLNGHELRQTLRDGEGQVGLQSMWSKRVGHDLVNEQQQMLLETGLTTLSRKGSW